MKTVTSVSGGKTSAFLAANYPTDYNVFALVRTEDLNCKFKDEKTRLIVEDRLQKPFIGTLEDDTIIYTVLDLEQHIGQKIDWVSGITFDEVVKTKGGWLPNKLHRYCTNHMKIEPIFYWWAEKISEPCIMNIGFRANETNRAKKSIDKCNENGLLEFKATFGFHSNGNKKWETIAWQKPNFPLITDSVFKDEIENYWKDKPVRFAERNNCVGCFHRNPILLRKMFDKYPEKMEWFNRTEKENNGGTWRSDLTYEKIKNHKLRLELDFSDFNDCDSGYCGL